MKYSFRSQKDRHVYDTRPVLALALSIRHGISCEKSCRMAGVIPSKGNRDQIKVGKMAA